MNRKQKRTKTAARVLAVIVALAMILMSGYYLLLAFSAGDAAFFVYAAESAETIEKNLSRLDELRSVVEYIHDNYADAVNIEDLADAAYNGVFDLLDPWSVYYKTQEEKDAFLDQVTGKYAGVGFTMGFDEEGRCVLVQVNPLGPAFAAGIQKGAILLRVDGKSVAGLPLAEISAMVRGDAGTEVSLEIEFGGEARTYTITRRMINAQTVEYGMLEDGIGYISISQFSGDSWREFRTAKLMLLAEGMKKMIVDIRGNGGGVLGDAINIACMLVEEGKPIVFFDQQGTIIESYYSEGGGYQHVPFVLLVNGGSASASECLAAAVKDNAAGTLVGTTTYGKGVAQTIVATGTQDYFKLSFCHFLTPKKARIDNVGVTPDIVVYNGAALSAEELAQLKEKLLPMESGRKYFAGQVGLTVLAAQQRLNVLGYGLSENARMDEKTVDALKRIQAMYGACPYGGLDYCTIELVERAFDEYINGDGTDRQLQKAIEVLR